MRTPFVAANWKMNTDSVDAATLAGAVARSCGQRRDVEVLLCPPFPYLPAVRTALAGTRIELGGQNCYCEPKGAYTGEVSPQMLRDVGCKWVLVGHSERRHIFGEKNEFLRKKISAAEAAGLRVIYCVGETMAQRQDKQTESVVGEQLDSGLPDVAPEAWANVVVAYEPVWAIGTGVNATPEQAEAVHQFVRHWLEARAGNAISQATRILYGGSVNARNAGALAAQANVDGFLVGGASLIAEDFQAIVAAMATARTAN